MILEKIVINRKRIIALIIVLLILIMIIFTASKIIEYKENNVDTTNAIHGVIIEKEVIFYKKPKKSRVV